jgi:hypothetical protein
MTYRWTAALRDALIEAELGEQLYAYDGDRDPEDEAKAYLTASMIALASIPLNSTLTPTEAELAAAIACDGDVVPGPTWAWIDQLVQFYYGNSPTVVELQR